MFFLYRTWAGRTFVPFSSKITASVIPNLTNSRLINLLSTFLNKGPLKLIVSISIDSSSIWSYKYFINFKGSLCL